MSIIDAKNDAWSDPDAMPTKLNITPGCMVGLFARVGLLALAAWGILRSLPDAEPVQAMHSASTISQAPAISLPSMSVLDGFRVAAIGIGGLGMALVAVALLAGILSLLGFGLRVFGHGLKWYSDGRNAARTADDRGFVAVTEYDVTPWYLKAIGYKRVTHYNPELQGVPVGTVEHTPWGKVRTMGGTFGLDAERQQELAHLAAMHREAAARRSGRRASTSISRATPKTIDALPAIEPPALPPLTTAQLLDKSNQERIVLGWRANESGGRNLATWQPERQPHLNIFGASGTGKTSRVGMLVALAAIRNGWHVVILDLHGGADWHAFDGAAEWHETNGQIFTEQIQCVHDEFRRRLSLLGPHGARTFAQLPVDIRPPRMVLMIEEFNGIRSASNRAGDESLSMLSQEARKTGISIVTLAPVPDDYPPGVRSIASLTFQQGTSGDGRRVDYHDAYKLGDGEFAMSGHHYQSVLAGADAPSILARLPELPHAPVVRSVVRSTSESVYLPEVDTPANARTNGSSNTPPNAEPERTSDVRDAIHAYLDAHPEASQSAIRTALGTSRGYTSDCWHEWHRQRSQPPTVPDARNGRREVMSLDELPEDVRTAIAKGKVSVG